jgi:ATP/maltotriose-dependent transcriptional regulator MalT
MVTDVAFRMTSPVFVGREEQLELLAAGLARAESGAPTTVVVGGEAGGGKSRLLAEFAAHATARGGRVLEGACVELAGEGLPYVPVIAILRDLLRDVGPERFADLTGGRQLDLAGLLPELNGPHARPAARGAEQMHGHVFEVLLDLTERLATERPLVILVEDVHWADRSTLDAIGFLVRSLRAAPVLFVLTYRSDELARGHPVRTFLAELERVRGVERVELPRLETREVAAQLQGILGIDPDPALVATIARRSQGNAFFVEELAAVARDDGDVSGGLSETLRDVLLSRVERLPEPTQRVLRVASAGGVRISHALLLAAAEMPEDELIEALRPAVAANVLQSDAEGEQYVFRHALVRDAVHDELLPGEHARVHVRFARALEADPALAEPSRVAAEVAQHWYAAHDAPRALSSAVAAAEQAASVSAFADELGILERALEMWDGVPDAASVVGVERLELLERAVRAGLRSGDQDRALALVDPALTEADAIGDPLRIATLLELRARLRRGMGRSGALEDLYRALELVPVEPPSSLRAVILNSLAAAYMVKPRVLPAMEHAEQALDVAREAADLEQERRALKTRGTVRAMQGDFEAGLADLEDARKLSDDRGGAEMTASIAVNMSDALEADGRHAEALEVALEGLEVSRRSGLLRHHGGFLYGNAAESLLSMGRWDEAEQMLNDGIALDVIGVESTHVRGVLGSLALWRGDMAAAASHLRKSRAVLARQYRGAQYTVPLDRIEAELALGEGRPEDAVAVVMRSLRESDPADDARYSWSLVPVGARALADAAARGRALHDDAAVAAARGTLAELTAIASRLRVSGTVAAAQQAQFLAETTRLDVDDTDGCAAWTRAARAWEDDDAPYPLAYALLRSAEACAEAGNRAAATHSLRRAAEICDRLGARPLRREIELLSRRAGVALLEEAPRSAADDASAVDELDRLGLTPREVEVLRLVADGASNNQIAEQLFITRKTASVHVSNILGKLGVSGRGEAAAVAHRLRLFDRSA